MLIRGRIARFLDLGPIDPSNPRSQTRRVMVPGPDSTTRDLYLSVFMDVTTMSAFIASAVFATSVFNRVLGGLAAAAMFVALVEVLRMLRARSRS